MAASAQDALETLQASILFEPDFPRRKRTTWAEFYALSELQRLQLHAPSGEAMDRAKGQCDVLQNLVRVLEDTKHRPAVPLLSRLWRECALEPVRFAAGRALFAIRTEQALAVLESTLDEDDYTSTDLAIKSIFIRDPRHAFDFFKSRFNVKTDSDVPVPMRVLELLSPSHFRGDGSAQWESEATEPLMKDQRWLDKCAELRHDSNFGRAARNVLRHAPRKARTAALSKARSIQAAGPRPAPSHTTRIGDLLARYRRGDHDKVWSEIRSRGEIGGEFKEEVLEVARETMFRVRANADLVSERLQKAGWKQYGSLGEMRTEPSAIDEQILDRIEGITGSKVPPSLLVFWQIVGGINWVWDYGSDQSLPDLGVDLPMEEMDPLCVVPPSKVTNLFEGWERQKKEPDPDLIEPFAIDLAPDMYHKANFSGGPAYAVLLPCKTADPVFENEPSRLPFVDYLRLCFRWAGFPMLGEHADRADVRRFVKEFSKDLIPF